MIDLPRLAADFADGLKAADSKGPRAKSPKGKQYEPGIGPFQEPGAVALALQEMRVVNPSLYATASPVPYPKTAQRCDLLIPGEWVAEVKLVRPFGDNGNEMEHWSENLLHPYRGNRSAVGDCMKLLESGFKERKTLLIYGFEHSPPKIELETAISAFELIATQLLKIELDVRHSETRTGLCHPYHQQLRVYAWEVL
jgi:hypothetical protein